MNSIINYTKIIIFNNMKVSKTQKFLTVMQIISLTIFIGFVIAYVIIRSKALSFIDEFDKELAMIEETKFSFDITFKRDIPFEFSTPLSGLLDVNALIPDSVHVNDSVPISMNVPISQTVTANVSIPLAGTQKVTFPINATIPVNTTVQIDDDINIEDVIVSDQQIEVSDSVPVEIDMEITKSIADLGLTQHISQSHKILNALRLFFLSKPKDLSDYDLKVDEVKSIDIAVE